MIRPPSLQINDTAVILSPAGKIDSCMVHDAAAVLKSWGLQPIIADHTLSDAGRFSGSVEERLGDLQQAFDDPAVKLVLCSRGGYGTVHLLSRLDFAGIRKNPKWVVGFSDITALHAALQHNGIASVHGPMAKHFSDEGEGDRSLRYIRSLLAGQSVEYRIPVTEGSPNREYDIPPMPEAFLGEIYLFFAVCWVLRMQRYLIGVFCLLKIQAKFHTGWTG